MRDIFIALAFVSLVFWGCASKKKIQPTTAQQTSSAAQEQPQATQPQPAAQEQITVAPKITTLYISQMTLAMSKGQQQLTMPASLSWQQSVGIIVSVQPIPGWEIIRAQITPESVSIVDKVNQQYCLLNYNDLKKKGLQQSYEDIEQWLCTNIIDHRDEPELRFSITQSGLILSAIINTRYLRTNSAVNMRPQNLQAYKQVSAEQLVRSL